VIKQNLIMTACAFSCAAAVITAQSPADRPQQPDAPRTVPQPGAPPAPAPSAAIAGQERSTTTLVGCLYREDQVPGRSPNVAEKAGVLEDYILADAAMPSAAPAQPGATAGAAGTTCTSTPATGNMYKVENIPDEQLKALVGKRVEVSGRIDAERTETGRPAGGATPDRGLGPDKINLPEFEAASIKEVPGVCPSAPAAR
jgi:hypothetical protein